MTDTTAINQLPSLSENTILWIIAGVLVIYCILLFRHQKGRHKRNIRRAKKILRRINDKKLSEGEIISYLRKIDPYVFEELVLLGFARKGFEIKRNERYSGDGGVDGRVYMKGQQFLLQCKRYARHINPKHVEDFAAACRREGCEGYFVHTGRTDKRSRNNVYIEGNVDIISGNRLAHLLMNGDKKTMLNSIN